MIGSPAGSRAVLCVERPAPSLPACQLGGGVGRLPQTPQLLDLSQLAALKVGQPASLPAGLGRSSVGQVANLPLRSGRLPTCPTTVYCPPSPQTLTVRSAPPVMRSRPSRE